MCNYIFCGIIVAGIITVRHYQVKYAKEFEGKIKKDKQA